MEVTWTIFKGIIDERGLSIQWIDINDTYYLKLFDGAFEVSCKLYKLAEDSTDKDDFEANYQAAGNIAPRSTTQFERTDLELKLARVKTTIVDGEGIISLKVPTEGRYVSGGWGIIDTYDPDDHCFIYVEDTDRIIATMNGGLSDEDMQAVIPGYPTIGSYTDTDLAAENQGWWFWPLNKHDGTCGELEFEPIGGYAAVPGDMYLVMRVVRPNVSGGVIRASIFWGKQS
jgi:hypothetical protein